MALSREYRLQQCVRACLKIHSRHLHAPLRGRFCPDSVSVAHYASFIAAKSPTKCDVHLTESNFQTCSSRRCAFHKRERVPVGIFSARIPPQRLPSRGLKTHNLPLTIPPPHRPGGVLISQLNPYFIPERQQYQETPSKRVDIPGDYVKSLFSINAKIMNSRLNDIPESCRKVRGRYEYFN